MNDRSALDIRETVQIYKSIVPYQIGVYALSACDKSNRKAMERNWSNQKANPALKTKAGNK